MLNLSLRSLYKHFKPSNHYRGSPHKPEQARIDEATETSQSSLLYIIKVLYQV